MSPWLHFCKTAHSFTKKIQTRTHLIHSLTHPPTPRSTHPPTTNTPTRARMHAPSTHRSALKVKTSCSALRASRESPPKTITEGTTECTTTVVWRPSAQRPRKLHYVRSFRQAERKEGRQQTGIKHPTVVDRRRIDPHCLISLPTDCDSEQSRHITAIIRCDRTIKTIVTVKEAAREANESSTHQPVAQHQSKPVD